MALSIGELVGYVDLDASKAEKAAGGIESMFDRLGGTWGKILGAAGAGGALAFGAGLVGGMDAEVGSDMLAASLGGGEKLAERYGDIAGRVYSNGFGTGLEDVNAAMGAVVTSIKGMRGASDKEVQAMTEKAMTYADVMGIDVTRAAQVAGNMVANGMAKNGGEAFDLLMKASQKVPVQLREDVLDATDEYGQFFTMLGIKGPEAMGLLAKGAEKGMYGIDKTGDAIKEFTIRSTDMSKSTIAAYEFMGMNSEKMTKDLLAGGERGSKAFDKVVSGLLKIKDPAQRANTSLALFGTPLEDLSTKDIPAFLKSLQGGEQQLGKFKGSVDKAGTTAYDNATSNLSMFTRTLKTGFVELIGGSVLPKVNDLTASLVTQLGPAFDTVSDATSATVGWLKQHQTIATVLAGVIGVLVAVTAAHSAVMAVSAAGGMMAWLTQTKLISSVTKVWTAVQWAMNAALAANPIGLVVVALAAIGVALVVAYKKSETFRNVVDKAMDAVRNAASATFGWFKKNWPLLLAIITGPIGMAVLAVVKNWDKIKSASSTAWNAVKGAVSSALGAVMDAIGGLANIPGKVSDWFGRAKDAASNKLSAMVSDVKGIPGKITGALGDLGGLLRDAGQKVIQGLIDGITEKVASLKSKLQSVTKLIPDWKGPAETDKKLLRRNGQLIMQGLIDGIGDGTKDLKGLLQSVTEDLGKKRMAKVEQAVGEQYARGLRIAGKRRKLASDLEAATAGLEDAIKVRDDFKASLLPPGLLDQARQALSEVMQLRDQTFSAVRDSVKSYASLSNIRPEDGAALTSGGVVEQLQKRLQSVREFRANMAALLAKGIDHATYQQMLNDGVEKAGEMAAVLVQDDGAVQAIAGLSTQIQAEADALGTDAATTLHGAGVTAAQALVDSLTAEQLRINQVAVDTARLLVDGLELDDAVLADKASTIAEKIRKALADALGVAIDGATGAAGDGGKSGKGGKDKDRDKGKGKDKDRNGRNAPLIGQVVQRNGESADALAERLWFKTRKRG